MPGESDTLINNLNTRINELTTQVAQLSTEAKRRRLELRATQKERDELRTQAGTITTDRDTWKSKAEADPKALQTKVDELTGQLRSRDHRDAWKDALGVELNDKVSIEDVWAKIDYKPGEKVPTAAEITEQVKPAREAAPYLFKPGVTPKPAPGGAKTGPALQTALAPSRGAPDTAARRFEVRKSEARNPAWMRQNRQNIEEARKAGTLVFIED